MIPGWEGGGRWEEGRDGRDRKVCCVTYEEGCDECIEGGRERVYMSRFANNALLGVRVRVVIREQRKIKRRSKTLLSL